MTLLQNLLSENQKSVRAALQFFEQSGEDNSYVYYDIIEDHIAHWKHNEITVVGVPKNPEDEYTVHSLERGEMEADESAVANLDIYKLERVY